MNQTLMALAELFTDAIREHTPHRDLLISSGGGYYLDIEVYPMGEERTPENNRVWQCALDIQSWELSIEASQLFTPADAAAAGAVLQVFGDIRKPLTDDDTETILANLHESSVRETVAKIKERTAMAKNCTKGSV